MAATAFKNQTSHSKAWPPIPYKQPIANAKVANTLDATLACWHVHHASMEGSSLGAAFVASCVGRFHKYVPYITFSLLMLAHVQGGPTPLDKAVGAPVTRTPTCMDVGTNVTRMTLSLPARARLAATFTAEAATPLRAMKTMMGVPGGWARSWWVTMRACRHSHIDDTI
eukprot:1160573-Pelagomonas_calceolata.AAC.34